MLENQKLIMEIQILRETTGFTWSFLSRKQLKTVLFVQRIKIPSTQNEMPLEVPLSSQTLFFFPLFVFSLSSKSENKEDSNA
jgi:hypothetical protein